MRIRHCKICGKSNDGTLCDIKRVCDFCLSIKIPCTCGCNQLHFKHDKRGREYKYVKGHDKLGLHCKICHKDNDGTLGKDKYVCDNCLSIQIPCACNCGQYRSKYGKQGRERKYINGHHWNGKHHTEESKSKQSESHIDMHCAVCGRDNDGTLISYKNFVCKECSSKMIFCGCGCKQLHLRYDKWGNERKYIHGHWTEEHKKKQSDLMKGSNHPNWKGGVTPAVERIRSSLKYDQWRQDVFKRDNYTCQKCGDSRGGNLKAHHIKEFALLLEKIKKHSPLIDLYESAMLYKPLWDIDNGITLCEDCHKKEHKNKIIG